MSYKINCFTIVVFKCNCNFNLQCLPFTGDSFASILLNNDNNKHLFIVHKNEGINIPIIKNESWNRIRLIWIGFAKQNESNKSNRSNSQSIFNRLPRDVIKEIINFTKVSFFDTNFSPNDETN